MFLYILGFMFTAWLLSFTPFDTFIMNGFAEVFGKTITSSGYYFISAFMGTVAWVISWAKRSN